MWATSDMPQATKRPSDSCAPATCARACGASVPHTWLTLTPTFSKTAPRMRRDSPPPCRRCPSGLLQRRDSKRASGSSAANATQTRSCRSRKYAVAAAERSSAPLMHVIDQARDRIRIGIGPDAMAEVEDVPGRGTGFFEHRIHVTPKLLRTCKKRRRIQVPLHRLG